MSERFFEAISAHFDDALPFVAYRKPNETTVKALLQKDHILYKTKDFTASGFVMAPFNSEKAALLIPTAHSEIIETAYTKKDVANTLHDKNYPFIEDNEKQAHIDLVKKGIAAIHSNQFEKVVLSRCETVALSNKNLIDIFKRLLNSYAQAFVYCWYHPNSGLWLGATPETLLKVNGSRFETMSLAGTQTYQGTLDVKWQPKELEEQEIVTNSIVNHLKDILENLHVSPIKTIKAGNVLHLQTKVSGVLNSETTLTTILQELHPTPAVCGFPKSQAKPFILDNEDYDREFYTGFLGELNMKQARTRNTNRRNVENNAYNYIKSVSHLFVNLRCMQLKHKKALLYVGGGITKDSDAKDEFTETLNKAQTMLKVLY